MPTTWNAIYLGNFVDRIDPTENDTDSENANRFDFTTYGSAGDPLANHIVSVQALDNGGTAGVLDTNNTSSNDQLRFDLGGGAGLQTTIYDGLALYDATLTYMDGTTATISAVIIQDTSGNLFLAPEATSNSDVTAMEAKPIRSLYLGAVTSNDANLTADRVQTAFICFVAGTGILTPGGEVPVETLRPGDLVMTMDHGPQPIRWVRRRQALCHGRMRPVRISAGALGCGLPRRDLLVSRQHRMMLRSEEARAMFGRDEVLVAAARLVGLPGISVEEGMVFVSYTHLLLDRHEILFADSAPSESLLPGPVAMSLLGPDSVAELLELVPFEGIDPARPVPSRRDQRRLVAQLASCSVPLIEARALA